VTAILSTEGVARGEREAFWRQALSETFVPMRVGEIAEDRFGGVIRADWVGRLMVAQVASTAQDVQRTSREIGRTDAEYLQLGLVYRGAARVTQDGREVVLHPGDYTIHETTRPFRWTFGADWDVGVFTLPRASVPLSQAQSRLLTARRLDGRTGITGVVSRFLQDLARHADDLSGTQSERVLADLTDLVLTLLGERADDSQAVRSSVQRTLMVRVKDYIQGRLADPTLGPAEIAAAVNISTRYLHMLFAAEHRSVSQHVRGLRLERCRRDLLDPRLADRSVASIAFGWGFGDLSGFNRAFKATFGATPREVRSATGSRLPPCAPLRASDGALPAGMVGPRPRPTAAGAAPGADHPGIEFTPPPGRSHTASGAGAPCWSGPTAWSPDPASASPQTPPPRSGASAAPCCAHPGSAEAASAVRKRP
jgi:AraC-like DNA-binding protein